VNQKYDVIILGAGAAGLMCAIEAGKRPACPGARTRRSNREKDPHLRRRPLQFHQPAHGPENFFSANPHFAKSTLARYTPADFVRLVEKHRIPYHEKKLGQLFCDRAASDITAMLEQECRDAGVEIRVNTKVTRYARMRCRKPTSSPFKPRTPASARPAWLSPRRLVHREIGATSFGYDLARQFGLKIEPPRAALVPLLFSERDCKRWCDLAGVSTEVVAFTRSTKRNTKQAFRENMLFTHRGISGPAILQISSCWDGKEPIHLDLRPAAISLAICERVAASSRIGNCC